MNQALDDLATSDAPAEQPLELSQAHYWQEHIMCWEQSGLSQSAYCRREGLTLHRWHYWHKKLSRSPVSGPKPASNFIPVNVMASPMSHELTITLANGITISGVSAQTLPLLSTVLKQL
jgi:hypothetical protein